MRRFLRSRRVRVVVALFVTLELIVVLGGCADKLILIPTTDKLRANGAAQRLLVADDGSQLELWTARSPGCAGREPAAYMIEFTGNGTRAEQVAQWAANRMENRAIEVWVMNYPGYGGSTGPAKLKSIPPAALRAFDAIKVVAGDRPIIVAGNSLGTASAMYVAAERPAAGLIVQSALPLRSLILGKNGWWNLWLLATPVALTTPYELDAPHNVARSTVPALFITMGDDTLIPPAYQQKLIDAYKGEKRHITVAGNGHNDSVTGDVHLQEFHDAVDWMLKGKTP